MYRLRLKEILVERQMTQSDLEELTGIQQPTISNWVRNSITSVNLPMLYKICKALDVSVEQIIVDDLEEGKLEVAA